MERRRDRNIILIKNMIHFYSCRDLKETIDFWSRFELKLFMTQPNTVIFDSGSGMIGFVEKQNHVSPSYSCVSFVKRTKDEVNEAYTKFYDVAVDAPAYHPTAPVYSFFIRDPNGILIEFQQFI